MRNLRFLLIAVLASALLAGGFTLRAQGSQYSPDQISQMVAPIALYPDALVSQVLMAATYPDQVTQADQWVQANPGLTGSALDDALATATWDPSIIALCKFPTVLDRMARNIGWTTDLGNAFLNQRTDVMNAVQTLRGEAYRNGSLRTTPQQRVVVQGPDIVIQPYTPDVIYVPAYEPAVVYGPLWSYPTYYYPSVWGPWPGYSFVNGFAWGIGFAFGNVLFGGCDWDHHDVFVNNTVILNNGIYRNCPYYRDGDWHGGYGHQTWSHRYDRASYARGWTGAPYGGRSYGRVNGVSPRSPAFTNRTTERAGMRSPDGYAGRGYSRPAVHGPVGYSRNDNARPAMRGPTNDTGRGYSRPAAHGPVGYSRNDRARPATQGPTGFSGRSYTRPEGRAPATYSRPTYSRPSVQAPSAGPRGGYGRPSVRAPGGVSGGYSRGGHGGAVGHASAPRGGGQKQHSRR